MIRLSALAGLALACLSAQPAFAACAYANSTLLADQLNRFQIVVRSGTQCPIPLASSPGPMFEAAVVQRPAHGSVSVQGHTVVYTARPGYAGLDSFAYVRKGLDHLNKPVTLRAQVAVRVVP